MTREEFTSILTEYNFSKEQVSRLWNKRPTDDLKRSDIHIVCQLIVERHKKIW